MKGGIATNLFVAEAIEELGLTLQGDLVFESVVDEEFGGVNGTLAARLMGFNGDAAILSEPSFLRICPAQRGGRTVHITLSSAAGGVLTDGRFPSGVIPQLASFLAAVRQFGEQRLAEAKVHSLYAHHVDPVPVSITKVHTGPWGTSEPTTIPEQCQLEMYWQTMPGESVETIDREFHRWLGRLVSSQPDVFRERPQVEYPIRWLPGSAISREESLVTELEACARRVIKSDVPVVGIEGPCDMYVFHQAFGIPAVLWGGKGGNTHGPDEYVDLDSLKTAAHTLLEFVCQWCGLDTNK
jgi:acetylornithine deacetylase